MEGGGGFLFIIFFFGKNRHQLLRERFYCLDGVLTWRESCSGTAMWVELRPALQMAQEVKAPVGRQVTQRTKQTLPGQPSPNSRNFKWQESEFKVSGSFGASEAIWSGLQTCMLLWSSGGRLGVRPPVMERCLQFRAWKPPPTCW